MPPLVRVPKSISRTDWPCYAEAADGTPADELGEQPAPVKAVAARPDFTGTDAVIAECATDWAPRDAEEWQNCLAFMVLESRRRVTQLEADLSKWRELGEEIYDDLHRVHDVEAIVGDHSVRHNEFPYNGASRQMERLEDLLEPEN